MKIEKAEYSAGALHLTTSDPNARQFCCGFKPGDYELAKKKKCRSLDANAYAWVLINKLSKTLNLPPVEVYKNVIRNIGGVCEIVCVKEKAADKLRNGWASHGLGWQTETIPSKIKGCVNVALWYGSSVYDVQQMSQLIDSLIADCKALDIETLPPEKLEGMLNEWA